MESLLGFEGLMSDGTLNGVALVGAGDASNRHGGLEVGDDAADKLRALLEGVPRGADPGAPGPGRLEVGGREYRVVSVDPGDVLVATMEHRAGGLVAYAVPAGVVVATVAPPVALARARAVLAPVVAALRR